MAPDWTDHDVSDPGITLLELFDYLGDGLAYSTGIGGTHGSPRRRVVAAGVLLAAGLLWWRSRLRTAG